MGLVRAAEAEGGWLILMSHEVAPAGGQATRPGVLEALCRHVTDPANGLWVDTVAAVGRYVRMRERRTTSAGLQSVCR